MNYIKRLKLLGFKKIRPIVICDYSPSEKNRGLYIIDLDEYNRLKETLKFKISKSYPSYINTNHYSTYELKVTRNVSLFILLSGFEYTLAIRDTLKEDKVIGYRTKNEKGLTYKFDISVPLHSIKINDNFWKTILDNVDKDIKREITIKNILKFQ